MKTGVGEARKEWFQKQGAGKKGQTRPRGFALRAFKLLDMLREAGRVKTKNSSTAKPLYSCLEAR